MPRPPADENPYAPPSSEGGELAPGYHSSEVDAETVKRFRREIQALGVFWGLIGLLILAIGLAIMWGGDLGGSVYGPPIAGIVFLAIGVAWFTLGVLACLKHLWAVYVGLGLSYVSLVGNLVQLNVCGLVILAVVILQSHRVIGWARQMQRAGLPLTLRPEQVNPVIPGQS